MKRQKIGRCYVQRSRDGTFKKWSNAGQSVHVDSRFKAKTKVKPEYGHLGDLRKRRR